MKIVFLDEATVGCVKSLDEIKALGEYEAYDFTSPSEALARMTGAEIVITNKVVLTREIIANSPSLKLICVAATGTNNVDLEAAAELGVAVKNVAGYSTESVVQMTYSLLFELLSHTSSFNNYIHSGEYSASPSFTSVTPPYNELASLRYGVIGLGAIGRRVAAVAEAFGASVCYCSTSGVKREEQFKEVSLDELLSTSDIISIHAPLNDKTKGLIDLNAFSKMKPTALLINVGRGGIVVEQDLVKALNEGLIAGAGLDVFTTEPLPKTNALLTFTDKTRLVMSPHIAWASVEARERLVHLVAKNISDFLLVMSY